MVPVTLTQATLEQHLAPLFQDFPSVRLAVAADETALNNLHQQTPMEAGPLSLAYAYTSHAKFVEETGLPAVTLVAQEGERLVACASISLRRGMLGSTSINYIYLSNLRISSRMSRGLRRLWRSFYQRLVVQLRTLQAGDKSLTLVTAVLDENAQAMQALTKRMKHVSYVPLQRYGTRTLLAPWPGTRFFQARRGYTIRLAIGSDLSRIHDFVGEQRHVASDCHTTFVAENAAGQLVGVLGLRKSLHRALVVRRASWRYRLCFLALRWLGGPTCQVGEPVAINSLCLFHTAPELTSHQHQALRARLLDFAFAFTKRSSGAHGFSMVFNAENDSAVTDTAWAQIVTRGTLFEVVQAGQASNPVLQQQCRTHRFPLEVSTS